MTRKRLIKSKKLVGGSGSNKTLFGPAKHQKYSDIVKIDDERNAKESAKKLRSEFFTAETKEKKRRVLQVIDLTKKRIRATLKRKNLRYSEKLELNEVLYVYTELGYELSDWYFDEFGDYASYGTTEEGF